MSWATQDGAGYGGEYMGVVWDYLWRSQDDAGDPRRIVNNFPRGW